MAGVGTVLAAWSTAAAPVLDDASRARTRTPCRAPVPATAVRRGPGTPVGTNGLSRRR
ncbi:hypothetical protein [Streptomyces aquilus]|uniref:hypothetical protein n=1 Tax=Streptomyces aquilus TaxID=2548456 RepID=UPI001416F8AD|nr:hypothetical protein [Streptomyces aquilus]